MIVDDDIDLNNAARYLRGQLKPEPEHGLSSLQDRRSHFELYRRIRRKAYALWSKVANTPCGGADSLVSDEVESWPDGFEQAIPCLYWYSGSWRYATASWCDHLKDRLKVNFVGYGREEAVTVSVGDPRIRRAVLDTRDGRGHPNDRALKGAFPKPDDHVRVHCLDAVEAPFFQQDGLYLAGVFVMSLAAHDSCLVDVEGLAGSERLIVPNTRMEVVSPQDSARVTGVIKATRNQVLRQLDISTSRTIVIEVVSGVGNVAGDIVQVSLWALGDRMLVKVWQEKGNFQLETSVLTTDAFVVLGMKSSGLTVLSESERKQLLDSVRERLRVSEGALTMDANASPRCASSPGCNEAGDGPFYRVHRRLEDVGVEISVQREGPDNLLIRAHTLPMPGPEQGHVEDILTRSEDWELVGFPSLCWLDEQKRIALAERLASCVCARDGSLALVIGERVLRSHRYIPITPTNDDQSKSSSPNGTLCPSGAPLGLCSCLVLLRVGASLPLSGTDIVPNIDQSRSRWLVLVKTNRDALSLSMCKPSFGASSSQNSSAEATEWNRTRSSERERTKANQRLQRVVLQVSWKDWAEIGYGPLQWMSHAQKAWLGALALSWVSLVKGEGGHEAFLKIRPTIAGVRRIVEILPNSGGPASDNGGIMSRVVVRDEGAVFGVEVEIEGQGASPCRRLSRSFGKEAWEETGLDDLLWMAWTYRRYVASRLSRQVFLSSDVDHDSERQSESLVIRSHLPLLYWSGTVAIARLGTHTAGVFVNIYDVGRGVMIEARDFEEGPKLASSTISLEIWRAATGVPAPIQLPTDQNAFRKRLEDRLPFLLGAGFSSRTSRFIKNRLDTQREKSHTKGKWRHEATKQITTAIRASEGSSQSASETPPRASLPTITEVAKKRSLMLNRMIDDFHLKHGRRDEGTGRTTPIKTAHDKGYRVRAGRMREPQAKDTTTLKDGAVCKGMVEASEKNNVATLFPTITAPYEAFEKGGRNIGSPGGLTCVCCGCEGGKGHGRRCTHKYRRCGFCRVGEVHRVLSTANTTRGNYETAARKGMHNYQQYVGENDNEDDYEWVTDTDDDDPEFKCDRCGRLISNTEDRFHCETCIDYDLCQACFLSHNFSVPDSKAAKTHMASHDVTRTTGKST